MPVFLFTLSLAFWPWFLWAADSPRWFLASLIIPLLFLSASPRMTPVHWLGLWWVAFAAASMWWTPSMWDGLNALWKLSLIVGVMMLAQTVNYRVCMLWAALGVGVSGALAVAQEVWGFDGVRQIIPPAGLFMNKNFLAEAGVLAFVAAAYYRRPLLVALTFPAAVLPGSLAAAAALGAVAVVWGMRRLWARSQLVFFLALPLVAGVMTTAASLLWWRPSVSVEFRLQVWAVVWNKLRFLGHGIGSFDAIWPELARPTDLPFTDVSPEMYSYGRQPGHPHNDLLGLASETGVMALIPAIVICTALYRGLRAPLDADAEAALLVLVAFLVLGLVGFPLANPFTAVVGALAAGYLLRPRGAVRG